LKNYWKAMMTSFSIKHPIVTIAFITSYLLPSLLLLCITQCWSWVVNRSCYIWIA